ncbi:hypothetical protein [Roseovarius pelagicus]|uniref:Uncharacterized protein n=1 Tax=Roseovarius pelagicus TaxID=2980108 RepID=A0ABY6DB56_9RHOB|nr:hypothetical protein [Roseovarius pelagicus]UXX83094.1 hypothetical protein N7U68_18770 [Roseovarius pelagicus]
MSDDFDSFRCRSGFSSPPEQASDDVSDDREATVKARIPTQVVPKEREGNTRQPDVSRPEGRDGILSTLAAMIRSVLGRS